MKAVLFATGPLDIAAAETTALQSRLGKDSVHVVTAPGEAQAFRQMVHDVPVMAAGPLLILRLWTLLGFASTEVLCLSQGGSHRFLKLLAYAVRGRVVFVRPDGRAPLGFFRFVWLILSRLWARSNGALLVGSASPETLRRLESDLQQRRPDAIVHVLENPSPLDYFRVAANWRHYRYLSIPWTGEGHNVLKFFAWLLPCGRREIYNEVGDSFSVRRVGVLLAHVGRRIREKLLWIWSGVRYLAWRIGDLIQAVWNGIGYAAWWTGDRIRAVWYARYLLIAIPPGVTVIGSASGYYLKDIVVDLRTKHPGEPMVGILPAKLIKPTAHLFDRVIPMRLGAILAHAFGRTRTGYCAIPCTNEGYNRYKLLGCILPLGRRRIYNENGDGYSVRVWRTLVTHAFWRLRHRLFYQALTQRKGRPWLLLVMHLLLYPFRLVAGAVLLLAVRARASQPPVQIVTPQADQPGTPAAISSSARVLDTAER